MNLLTVFCTQLRYCRLSYSNYRILIDRLINWLTHWLFDWPVDWFTQRISLDTIDQPNYESQFTMTCKYHKGNIATVTLLIHPAIHRSMSSAPFGVQCPLTSSLGEFLGYWDWLWLSPVFAFITSPFAFHISVCFHLLFTCNWISFVFLLYGRRICTHSVDPSLTHLIDSLPKLLRWATIQRGRQPTERMEITPT